MDQQTGKYIIIAGVCIVITGLVIYFFHDYFKWLGRLPGDVRIEKNNARLYFPIVTMIIISLAATIIINILRKFF